MTVQIVEGRGYVPDGKGGIVLLGEWGRDVTIECAVCGATKLLRLCADEILTDIQCDSYMDAHLRGSGWSVAPFDGGDRCPDCTRSAPL